MRRFVVGLLLTGVVLPLTGCVFAVDVREVPRHRQVVEVDGELYLVDLKTQCAKRMKVVWEVDEDRTSRTTEETVDED